MDAGWRGWEERPEVVQRRKARELSVEAVVNNEVQQLPVEQLLLQDLAAPATLCFCLLPFSYFVVLFFCFLFSSFPPEARVERESRNVLRRISSLTVLYTTYGVSKSVFRSLATVHRVHRFFGLPWTRCSP